MSLQCNQYKIALSHSVLFKLRRQEIYFCWKRIHDATDLSSPYSNITGINFYPKRPEELKRALKRLREKTIDEKVSAGVQQILVHESHNPAYVSIGVNTLNYQEGRSHQNLTDSRSLHLNAGGSNGQDQWLEWTKLINRFRKISSWELILLAQQQAGRRNDFSDFRVS